MLYTTHPAGSSLTSDWLVNSFIMVVESEFSVQIPTKKFSKDNHHKLFTNQSEVSVQIVNLYSSLRP